MNLSYTVYARTADDKRISGVVFFNSHAVTTDTTIQFNITAYLFQSGDSLIKGGSGGYISTLIDPSGSGVTPGGGTLNTADGQWVNAASGVWFRYSDGVKHDASIKENYEHLPSIIEINADGITGGPFQPDKQILLAWNPCCFYLEDQGLYAEPSLLPPVNFHLE